MRNPLQLREPQPMWSPYSRREEEGGNEMDDVKDVAGLYEGVQKLRVMLGNRIGAVEDDRSEASPATLEEWQGWFGQFQELEGDIADGMAAALEFHPLWPWLQCVKGIGPVLSARMLGQIPGIEGFETVSQLWRFAGLGVVDGKAERLVKGEKAHFNKKLKTIMYNIGRQFLKAHGQYTRFYYEAKGHYQAERPEWTKGHVDLAAMRKMEKMFLSHVWAVWRSEVGLETRPLYVIQHGGHDGVVLPRDVVPGYDYQHGIWEG
jgi:hypothetical protein